MSNDPNEARGIPCLSYGGGDRGGVAIYIHSGNFAGLHRTVTCMGLKANDSVPLAPCHDEFRGPRSDYVRQVALETTTDVKKRNTINDEYRANLLQRLSEEIKQKRPHLAQKKVTFHQDNAPSHKSVVALAKINDISHVTSLTQCGHGHLLVVGVVKSLVQELVPLKIRRVEGPMDVKSVEAQSSPVDDKWKFGEEVSVKVWSKSLGRVSKL
ncbi:hypothetical protein TNCV_4170401 [Trichonephila clavipes]|nr:hypothetical protein TNCV_4170401 [Trichonephila clavipes]